MGSREPRCQRRADVNRVSEDLRQLADIGADVEGGVTRLAFSRDERAAHAFMSERMRKVGLDVTVDAFGNTYGRRPGRRSDLPALAFGSHVDTVPNGGRYDGAVGTVAALEVMRILEDHAESTEHALVMVIFAAEEGARFGKATLGSRAAAGVLTRQDLTTLRDGAGITLAEAIRSAGLDPDSLDQVRWPSGYIGAFIEMHIEQGQVLEAERIPIGLVESIAGNTRLQFTIHGNAVHSGATPMHVRRDALAAAGEMIVGIEEMANDYRRRATVATVGRMEVWPNSITTIAGRVVLYVDVRDIDGDRQRETANGVLDLARRLEEKRGVTMDVAVLSDTSPSILPTWLRRVSADACEANGVPYRIMSSGAGHDAATISADVPAAMIFVPSQNGISHAPGEWTSPEDIATGIEVLAESVMTLDRFLAGQVNRGE